MPSLTAVDWVALAIVAFFAFSGWRRGLIASALSLLGLVAGAYAGSRLAPHLLSGGATSRWTPVASLVGAIVGATLLQTVAALLGAFVRGGLRLTPVRFLDSAAGVVFGAVTGLAFVWVLGATALLLPGQTRLRHDVLRSTIVRRLEAAVPPRSGLHLLARIDPLPSVLGPAAPNEPPSPSVRRNPVIRRASASVVRVLGTACGVGVEGTGWFARPGLVVTAAHVVAGESDTHIQLPGSSTLVPAKAVLFDSRNDIALLAVNVHGRPLPLQQPQDGAAVAIVGYPEDGPLTATPSRVGRTATVLTQNAYGRGPVSRTVTALAGNIRHGDSGGPAIDTLGRVQATVFAARIGSDGGFGTPTSIVADALRASHEPVSTGSCAAG